MFRSSFAAGLLALVVLVPQEASAAYYRAAPTYRAPVYQYRAPVQQYRAPVYRAPVYRTPAYRAPAYRAPTQRAIPHQRYVPNHRVVTPRIVPAARHASPGRMHAGHIPRGHRLGSYRPWRWAAGAALVGAGAYYYYDMVYTPVLVPDNSGEAFDIEAFIRTLEADGSIPTVAVADDEEALE